MNALVLALLLVPSLARAQAPGSWLDRQPVSWNVPPNLPTRPGSAESSDVLTRRCGATTLKGSRPAEAVARAGWVPYLHLDRAIARDDVEVIAGMVAAGPGCMPETYNLFVFVQGTFAGTLSPLPMAANRDGEAGAVRIGSADQLTAEFARYLPGDPECCPSSRVRVTYRIERQEGKLPLVRAAEIRRIR